MTQSSSKELLFLPLGGAGEIGMNLNLYGFGRRGQERWMMVDLGITFGNGSLPGVDVIMPDPTFIADRRDRLDGLVLTHAHEDHLGAVAYLWERLRCPIYATPFTISVLTHKLREAGLEGQVPIIEVPLNGEFTVGPFDLELITLTHSIPEPNGIAIRTPLGTVLHTGDWKFDPGPVVGPAFDEEALRRLGGEGVLAIVCDSTNVFNPGTSGSEADLLESLTELIRKCENRVAVACFSSNIARLETVAAAAQACGRDVVLSGRSLQRMVEVARENGYLSDTPAFLQEEDAGHLPRGKTLIICTGSQGEPRASLARIAFEDHPRLTLEEDDTVIFSAREIPGNETTIGRLQNQLARRGINLITPKDHFVHVSGHPARDELVRMYQHVRPRISVPVHGEARHLAEHARLARECQVAETVVTENGGMVRLAPGPARLVDQAPVGRLALEGNRVVKLDGELVRGRTRAMYNGSAVVTIVLNGEGQLAADPILTTTGLLEPDDQETREVVFTAIRDAMSGISKSDLKDLRGVQETLRIAVRRAFRNHLDKKPVTSVHLVRI